VSKSHSKETNNLHSQVSRDFHKGPIRDGVLIVPRLDVFAICVEHRWPNHIVGIVYILLFQRLVSTQWSGRFPMVMRELSLSSLCSPSAPSFLSSSDNEFFDYDKADKLWLRYRKTVKTEKPLNVGGRKRIGEMSPSMT